MRRNYVPLCQIFLFFDKNVNYYLGIANVSTVRNLARNVVYLKMETNRALVS